MAFVNRMEIQLYGDSNEQNGIPQPEVSSEEQQESSSKKQFLPTSEIIGSTKAFFRVFRFSKDDEEYLLEVHQAETDDIDRYHVILGKDKNNNDKYCIDVSDLETGQYVVFPVTEDSSCPKFFKKYPLPLQERLDGWTIERRIRIRNHKEESFYRHASRTFRSLVEAVGFILYSCKPKDLQPMNPEEETAKDLGNSSES